MAISLGVAMSDGRTVLSWKLAAMLKKKATWVVYKGCIETLVRLLCSLQLNLELKIQIIYELE